MSIGFFIVDENSQRKRPLIIQSNAKILIHSRGVFRQVQQRVVAPNAQAFQTTVLRHERSYCLLNRTGRTAQKRCGHGGCGQVVNHIRTRKICRHAQGLRAFAGLPGRATYGKREIYAQGAQSNLLGSEIKLGARKSARWAVIASQLAILMVFVGKRA